MPEMGEEYHDPKAPAGAPLVGMVCADDEGVIKLDYKAVTGRTVKVRFERRFLNKFKQEFGEVPEERVELTGRTDPKTGLCEYVKNTYARKSVNYMIWHEEWAIDETLEWYYKGANAVLNFEFLGTSPGKVGTATMGAGMGLTTHAGSNKLAYLLLQHATSVEALPAAGKLGAGAVAQGQGVQIVGEAIRRAAPNVVKGAGIAVAIWYGFKAGTYAAEKWVSPSGQKVGEGWMIFARKPVSERLWRKGTPYFAPCPEAPPTKTPGIPIPVPVPTGGSSEHPSTTDPVGTPEKTPTGSHGGSDQPTTTGQGTNQPTTTGPDQTPEKTPTGPHGAPEKTTTGPQGAPEKTPTGPSGTNQPSGPGGDGIQPPTTTGPQGAPEKTPTGPSGTNQPSGAGGDGTQQPTTTGPHGAPEKTPTGPHGADQPTTGGDGTQQPTTTGSDATTTGTTTGGSSSKNKTITGIAAGLIAIAVAAGLCSQSDKPPKVATGSGGGQGSQGAPVVVRDASEPAVAVVQGTAQFTSSVAGQFSKRFLGRPLFNGPCREWATKGDNGKFAVPGDLVPNGTTVEFTWSNFIAVSDYPGPGTYDSNDRQFFGGITLRDEEQGELASTTVPPGHATITVQDDGSGSLTFSGPDFTARVAGDKDQTLEGSIVWTCSDEPLDETAYTSAS